MVKELKTYYNPEWHEDMIQRQVEQELAVRLSEGQAQAKKEAELKAEKNKKYGGILLRKQSRKFKAKIKSHSESSK